MIVAVERGEIDGDEVIIEENTADLTIGERRGRNKRCRKSDRKESRKLMNVEDTLTALQEQTRILAAAQIGQETRLARVEEGFQQIALAIRQLTELSTATDGRLDPLEEGQAHTDARLDALIDAQIALG